MAINNSTILNNVRLHLSNDFQQVIPETTQASFEQDTSILFDQGPVGRNLYNEFEAGLLNLVGKVVINDWQWENPLRVFKRDGLLGYGDKIEEIAMDLLEAKGYDARSTDLFKQNPGKVYAAFHTVNRKDRFDITINKTELRQAFLSENGISNFISLKLSLPLKSDNYAEYTIMKQLLQKAVTENKVNTATITFADPARPTEAELKELSLQLRIVGAKMQVSPTGLYNKAGVPTVTRKEDLVLITTPEVRASMDVNVLADAFHIDRTDFVHQIVIIDEFPVDGVYAALVDRHWFVCGDYERSFESFYNPSNMSNNFYYHRWGVYSTSTFMNAVLFGDITPTEAAVVDVTLTGLTAKFVESFTDAEVNTYSYGDDIKIVTEGVGTVSNDDEDIFTVPGAATFAIAITDADGENVVLNSRTYVDRTGRLYVQKGLEAGSTITVTAVSTYVDPSGDGTNPSPKTATVSLTVA